MKSLKRLRKHTFKDSGVCAEEFLERNPDMCEILLYDVMRKNGYAPIVGTERVDLSRREDGVVEFDVSIRGAYLGDNVDRINYFTKEGVTVWNRTQQHK